VSDSVRVLIVDDSTFIRRAVERMLAAEGGIEIVGSAADGAEAVEGAKALRPDVIVMDVNMPGLDGLEALGRIMTEAPTKVLMLSSLTTEGADTTLKALELGAVDFLDKAAAGTSMDIYSLAPLLREKVLTVAGAAVPAPVTRGPDRVASARRIDSRPRLTSDYGIIAIGASTGGPRALTEILCALPADLPTGIVVAQHMPAGFTQTFAARIDKRSELEVLEGEDLMEVRPARAIIAPGGRQTRVERRQDGLVIRVSNSSDKMLHRPSIDLLFKSVAEVVGGRSVGVILTGMGDDGARGMKLMRAAGSRTVAESEETAVIYGMPKAARPFADEVVRLDEIASTIVRTVASETRESFR
jgi:two-component system, chemotaxis family, protein-glutamate methylesterase/glutaminase